MVSEELEAVREIGMHLGSPAFGGFARQAEPGGYLVGRFCARTLSANGAGPSTSRVLDGEDGLPRSVSSDSGVMDVAVSSYPPHLGRISERRVSEGGRAHAGENLPPACTWGFSRVRLEDGTPRGDERVHTMQMEEDGPSLLDAGPSLEALDGVFASASQAEESEDEWDAEMTQGAGESDELPQARLARDEPAEDVPKGPAATRDNAALMTPPRRTAAFGDGMDGLGMPHASPGEGGGLLYIQSPPPGASRHHAQPPRVPLAPLYAVFLPRGQKVLHLVRHGESTYNQACGAPGSSWEDPDIFDARLTERGRQQAIAVGPQLAHVGANALWVTSPLTRAIQTCLLARSAARGPSAQSEGARWVTIQSALSEHLMTSGDVGRPKAHLQVEFPELSAAAMEDLSEHWWYNQEGQPQNCALARQMGCREPKKEFKSRVGRFRKWALSRPEAELVVFGHSTFFKELMGGDRRLANCEVFTLRL